jgi:hypothetical protein
MNVVEDDDVVSPVRASESENILTDRELDLPKDSPTFSAAIPESDKP